MDQEHYLFYGFPNRSVHPFSIHASFTQTTPWNKEAVYYCSSDNFIGFVDCGKEDLKLILYLARELGRVACSSYDSVFFETDSLAQKQLKLLQDACAAATQRQVEMLLFDTDHCTRTEAISGYLKAFNDSFEKDSKKALEYQTFERELGLTEIPDYFNIPKPVHRKILTQLQDVPKEEYGVVRRIITNAVSADDMYTFAHLSDDNMRLLLSKTVYTLDEKIAAGDIEIPQAISVFSRVLDMYDQINGTQDLGIAFSFITYEIRLFNENHPKVRDKSQEFKRELLRTWLDHQGTSAIRNAWIEDSLDPELEKLNFISPQYFDMLLEYKTKHPSDARIPFQLVAEDQEKAASPTPTDSQAPAQKPNDSEELQTGNAPKKSGGQSAKRRKNNESDQNGAGN